MSTSPLEILLVDNDLGTVQNMQKLFHDIKIRNNLNIVENSGNALAYLRREASYQEAKRPDIVLIDWNISQTEDSRLLTDMLDNSLFSEMTVVLLVDADIPVNLSADHKIRFKHYLKKPFNAQSIVSLLKRTDDLWISIVRA